MVFLLTHLYEIDPVFSRIFLAELKKARRFSFRGKNNKEAPLDIRLDLLLLKPLNSCWKPNKTDIRDWLVHQFNHLRTTERTRKCLQLALAVTNLVNRYNILYTCSIFTIFHTTFWETSIRRSTSVGSFPRVTAYRGLTVCHKKSWEWFFHRAWHYRNMLDILSGSPRLKFMQYSWWVLSDM